MTYVTKCTPGVLDQRKPHPIKTKAKVFAHPRFVLLRRQRINIIANARHFLNESIGP